MLKCAKKRQSYLKIQYSLNNPNPECFYLVIQLGSIDKDKTFRLLPTFVTLDTNGTSTQKPFRVHQSVSNLKIMTWIQDLLHPR